MIDDYKIIDYNKILDKYVLIKNERYYKPDYINEKNLRQYNIRYITNIKAGYIEPRYLFFIITNLEYLGKQKSAERLYVYFLSKGWIEGL